MTDRRGIEIPADIAERESVPDDLDSNALDPYAVPDVARRKRAAFVLYAMAALTAVVVATTDVPAGMWFVVVALGALGLHHQLTAWPLKVREGEALERATVEAGFAVGHASAALSFEGPGAKPVWNVLVFSADEPPSRRALVRVDALDGSIRETYAEDVPAAEWEPSAT